MSSDNIDLTEQWANIYRMRGFQPLPSSPSEKKPMIEYSDLWDRKASDDLFQQCRTINVQVCCGRFWRLLVIDLDGPEAQERWQRMGRCPRTWISHSGGGGRHLWFRLPEGLTEPLPKAFLWKGTDKHQAIERLCDHSLVMAPPSIHPTTGRMYRFEDKWHSPLGMGLPADIPRWVLELRPTVQEPANSTEPFLVVKRSVATPESGRMTIDEILACFPDKISLTRSWGIRFASRLGNRAWAPCHSVDREDVHPSAAINRDNGYYIDKGSGLKLSLFDLGVRLGVFRDRREAFQTLANGRTRP